LETTVAAVATMPKVGCPRGGRERPTQQAKGSVDGGARGCGRGSGGGSGDGGGDGSDRGGKMAVATGLSAAAAASSVRKLR